MQRPLPAPTQHWIKLLVAGALIASTSPIVHASYTVMDDDLYPTAYIQARETQLEQSNKTVPFARQRSALGPAGRAALDALIPMMRNASVRITGRPDATTQTTGAQSSLASDRAITAKNYLVSKGVNEAAIKIEADESPNPQPNGSVYPIDIHISHQAAPPAAFAHQNDGYQPPSALPPSHAAPTPQTTAAPTDSNASTELIRYINAAVKNGEMDSKVAIKLLAELAPQNPKWEILTTDGTLQNTFERWGKVANWEVKWLDIPDIKNPGHVVSLPDGEFLTTAGLVLKQAQRAAKEAGMELSVKAYPNRVLVISKASIK